MLETLNGRLIRLFCAAMLLLPLSAWSQQTLMVAGGGGYKRPIDEIMKGFESGHDIKVERFYGNMGQVLSQTHNSGHISVVFGEADFLGSAKQVKFDQFIPIGAGRLVLAWPKGKTVRKASDITGAGFERIALPNTKMAVFGKAAVEYLKHSGAFPSVEKRLLVVGMVPQVSSYLVSGEVDAGFINLTEALAIKDKIGGYLEIPQSDYTPISIVAAPVQGQESEQSKALIAYLHTPEAQEIIRRNGL